MGAAQLPAPDGVAAETTLPASTSALGLGRDRDGLVHVPAGLPRDRPGPLLVVLHGAGSTGAAMLEALTGAAGELPGIVLAPDSRGRTWDVILGGFGPDVAFLQEALASVCSRAAVDLERVVLAGFSDGASYVLSLGLSNGDLFRRLVAFSPGFMAPDGLRGRPPVFVSHGVADPVLPIERCSRRIVPALRAAGYDVRYEEFEGGHVVPPAIGRAAFDQATA
jgi:phospholipase/carboxylesterase